MPPGGVICQLKYQVRFPLSQIDFHLLLALASLCARNILASAISSANLPTSALKMDPGMMIDYMMI